MPINNNYTFSEEPLQSYISKRQAQLALTIPGYEIYFYSRFDPNTLVTTKTNPDGTPIGFSNIPPTLAIKDTRDRSKGIPLVTSIEVTNTIDDEGSSAKITLIQAQGTEYFQSTIGNSNVNTPPDYDFSVGANTTHRIGLMDTVLIKLINRKSSVVENEKDQQRETVFRGVIGEINRTESVQGATIVLQLYDFSEFMRRALGVRNGLFNTISLSLTGRGLVDNITNYTNNLLSGQKAIFQLPITSTEEQNFVNQLQKIANALPALTDAAESQLEDNGPISITNFPMDVPPFLHLEYSEVIPSDIIQQLGQNGFLSIVSSALNTVVDNAKAFAAATATGNASKLNLTPEDKQTSQFYAVAMASPSPVTSGVTSVASQNAQGVTSVQFNDLQRFAWILSDLYLEKGLITFEHQYMWSVVSQTAQRGFREVYFDIKPKLAKRNPSISTAMNKPTVAPAPYVTAYVSEQKLDKTLDDIHPNIGILKYRLSPGLIPYQSSSSAQSLEFWFYDFGDEDIVSYQGMERERGVFTHVLGYGSALTDNPNVANVLSLATSEHKGFALAASLDNNITRRFGYRFLSDHDAKLTIPILRYFVSYVLLEKSILSMFAQQIVVAGRPDVVPGSIVRLRSRGIDYYCTRVLHNWSLDRGYQTALVLSMGHKTGVLPSSILNVNGLTVDMANAQCISNNQVMSQYLKGVSPTIGGVQVGCFLTAIWSVMANNQVPLPTNDSYYQQHTKEAAQTNKGAAIASSNGDWIQYIGPTTVTPPAVNVDNIISSCLNGHPIQQYNFTFNTIKNIVFDESSFNPNSVSSANAVGLFQILFGPGVGSGSPDNSLNGLTPPITWDEAKTDLPKACTYALNLLYAKTQELKTPINCSGVDFLKVIGAYNGIISGDPWGNSTYVNKVLGNTQAAAIANGTRKPGSSSFSSNGNSAIAWPYYVYGPLGIRVSQAIPSITVLPPTTNTAYIQERNTLETFGGGMTAGVSYIIKLLNKYSLASSTLPGSISKQFSNCGVSMDTAINKTLASWFSGDIADSNFNATLFSNVVQQIQSAYSACQSCNLQSTLNGLGGYVAPGTINAKILQAALAYEGTDTSGLRGGGSESCVASLQIILANAGINTVASNTAGVSEFETGLQSRAAQVTSSTPLLPGDIWIINGHGAYHVGVVTAVNNATPSGINILSNSSSARKFSFSASQQYYDTQGFGVIITGYDKFYRMTS